MVKIRGKNKDCVVCGDSKKNFNLESFDYEQFIGVSCSTSHKTEKNISWEDVLKKEDAILVDCRAKE